MFAQTESEWMPVEVMESLCGSEGMVSTKKGLNHTIEQRGTRRSEDFHGRATGEGVYMTQQEVNHGL